MSDTSKILIVDDDKFLMGMYSLKFKKAGFEVVAALSPEEALQKLHDGFHPDIFLMDVIMPGMSGLDLLEQIQKENLIGASTVVILSNQGESTDIDRAKQLHVNGYIVKATTIPSEVVDEVVKIHKAHMAKPA